LHNPLAALQHNTSSAGPPAPTFPCDLLQVRGSFSFVIFDQAQHRVFAARDAEGSQPLHWGSTGAWHAVHVLPVAALDLH
jgi:asparagine synthetase B (glutamine-hydrolysing)